MIAGWDGNAHPGLNRFFISLYFLNQDETTLVTIFLCQIKNMPHK